jgi:hypothetical protein
MDCIQLAHEKFQASALLNIVMCLKFHKWRETFITNAVHVKFYVLLTVHLGSVLVNNQLEAQFFFRIYLFQFSICFEHPCAHHQENQLY